MVVAQGPCEGLEVVGGDALAAGLQSRDMALAHPGAGCQRVLGQAGVLAGGFQACAEAVH